MTDVEYWVEAEIVEDDGDSLLAGPDGGDGRDFTDDDVEYVRALVGRSDRATVEQRDARLKMGERFEEIAPKNPETGARAHAGATRLKDLGARVGMAYDQIRECQDAYVQKLASCPHFVWDRAMATGVSFSWSVLREAALNTSGSPLSDEDRWLKLAECCEEAKKAKLTRLTATEYRTANGAKQIPNSANAMTVEKLAERIRKEPEFRADVLKVAQVETKKASQIEGLRKIAEEGTVTTPAGQVIEVPEAVKQEVTQHLAVVDWRTEEQTAEEWAEQAFEKVQEVIAKAIEDDPEIKACEQRAKAYGVLSKTHKSLQAIYDLPLEDIADDDLRKSVADLVDSAKRLSQMVKKSHLRAVTATG
ncbi:hypothetical protein P3T36_004833 [Kitasatospora sp. MAP12-15]|uniref:hypothetical protein n=1 Tax=unclassified Kitasatospora TaxID=2633591 RepID=UPI0024745B38|nr:hypothetical protein [Kitasatospora sp. MAP12-44]MDH6110235.1 hypothetical protein [Kitasatospora sp. MAP12-44]